MGSIVLLDENTINKIAAGEVVDRPASIVKELVENSIDANSTNITIEIKNGGISYIKIQDDGDGFKSDDVEMAFERHATSKIRKEADILKIKSMGFRGEALASVAAISKVLLVTKHKDEKVGTKIMLEAGNIISKEKSASNKGSTIYIKDIFFNTPARFKFLKKDYTEAGYIEDAVIRICLANPSIAIKYINNGKVIISTNGDSKLSSVIYSIFGKDTYSNILDLNYTYEDIHVSGVLGLKDISRSSRTNEYTYINSRFVKDKTLMSAIEKGYTEKLGINKFPFAVINVEINPETIDVNVHPAKLEVKFENENKVFEAVYFAVKDRLEKENKEKSPFSIINSEINNIDISYAINEITSSKEKNNKYQDIGSAVINSNDEKTDDKKNSEIEQTPNYNDLTLKNKFDEYTSNGDFLDKSQSLYSKEANSQNKLEEKFDTYCPSENQLNVCEKVYYKYLGCAFDTYIIIQIKETIYIIDQHAAHERLIYEEFKKHFYSKEKETQMLMIPMLIELKNNEVKTVIDNIEYFEKCGYILEKFSENSIKISGVPNIADIHLDDKSMFLDMIDELMQNIRTERQDREFRFLATVACKAAVKGNMSLNKEEHIKLLDEMLKLENPFTCPHGRPTAYEITKYDIERKFNRK